MPHFIDEETGWSCHWVDVPCHKAATEYKHSLKGRGKSDLLATILFKAISPPSKCQKVQFSMDFRKVDFDQINKPPEC